MSYSQRTIQRVRADRLLRIMLTLQRHGRMTAAALAERVEVNVRTIQRDMDALSGAGIPVYALRGGGGGWELLPDYRTGLTGLTADDAVAIMAGRPPRLLEDLGIDVRDDSALLKLVAALGPEARARVEHATQRLHVDLAPWGASPRPADTLQLLQRAVWDDRAARITYRGNPRSIRLEPYALVCKGTVWYLLARTRHIRTYRVDRITRAVVLDERFERADDFDLDAHWRAVCEEFGSALPTYVARLLVRGPAAARVHWSTKVLDVGPADRAGWYEVTIDAESENEAISVVLALAPHVRVLEPSSLDAAARDAAATYLAQPNQ